MSIAIFKFRISSRVSETVTKSNLGRQLVVRSSVLPCPMPPLCLSLPSSTLWALPGSRAPGVELQQRGAPPPGRLTHLLAVLCGQRLTSATEGSLLAPSCLPPDRGGRRRATFPPQQVPAIYLKIVANIWYNCLRKRSNKAACSSGAERASLL